MPEKNSSSSGTASTSAPYRCNHLNTRIMPESVLDRPGQAGRRTRSLGKAVGATREQLRGQREVVVVEQVVDRESHTSVAAKLGIEGSVDHGVGVDRRLAKGQHLVEFVAVGRMPGLDARREKRAEAVIGDADDLDRWHHVG